MEEDELISYGRSMEGDKCTTSWEKFGGGLTGCSEGLCKIETCEVKIGGPVRVIGTFHEEKKERNDKRTGGEGYSG